MDIKKEYERIKQNYKTWTIIVKKGTNFLGGQVLDDRDSLLLLKDYGFLSTKSGCGWKFEYKDVVELKGIDIR